MNCSQVDFCDPASLLIGGAVSLFLLVLLAILSLWLNDRTIDHKQAPASVVGAGGEDRTLGINHGKVALYR